MDRIASYVSVERLDFDGAITNPPYFIKPPN
jgi:hypothetical protein